MTIGGMTKVRLLRSVFFDELRALIWDSLRCSTNSEHTGFEVDVGPFEPKRLALSKAKGQRDRVQSL